MKNTVIQVQILMLRYYFELMQAHGLSKMIFERDHDQESILLEPALEGEDSSPIEDYRFMLINDVEVDPNFDPPRDGSTH